MTLPYQNAQSGAAALSDIERMLRRFGCSNFAIMSDWQQGFTAVGFEYRGRRIRMEASWKGYAALWLKENPWNSRRKHGPERHQKVALERGEMAVPSILRDWIKGNIVALECGVMDFDDMFIPHMLLPDGTRVIEVVRAKLPPLLEGPK